jgi:hypothetical protein
MAARGALPRDHRFRPRHKLLHNHSQVSHWKLYSFENRQTRSTLINSSIEGMKFRTELIDYTAEVTCHLKRSTR